MDNHCVVCGEYLADTSRMVCEKCEKPCDTCKKVDDPEDCERKQCGKWKHWWLRRWEALRNGKEQNG